MPLPPPALLVCYLCLFLFFCYSPPFALSASIISHLPGFPGPLPFHLETGYVGVDEAQDVQLFYYFLQSEGNPEKDPLLLWLTGGPGCSALSGLAFEIGPLTFKLSKYNGSLPTLILNPYSWTKVSNIIFLDSPVGSGFSYSRSFKGKEVGDISSSKQIYKFMRQWLIDHPQFLSNPFYIAGDSYAGKITPVIAQEISEGIEVGHKPLLNLKGYMIGNPVTGERIDYNARIPYAYGVGIISKELYELTSQHCEGQAYDAPNSKCAKHLNAVKKFLSDIQMPHILEPKCARASPRPKNTIGHLRSLKTTQEFLALPPIPELQCRSYPYYLSYLWANNNATRKALHIKKGTVEEWQRCNMRLSYARDVPSSIKYHLSLTSRGYRALVYSGDHDMVIPFLGTETWVKSLNFSILYERRSWSVDGQIAGYTRTYSNNLTFATVKGAGHTAPEYRPKECLAMVQRWFSHSPL